MTVIIFIQSINLFIQSESPSRATLEGAVSCKNRLKDLFDCFALSARLQPHAAYFYLEVHQCKTLTELELVDRPTTYKVI